ncbi:hypothetical protein FACS1894195_2100 [Bacteroidia bacterium]|nr:hypothetical protein FACS1894195_2100 [Bacteroidia bacterium]
MKQKQFIRTVIASAILGTFSLTAFSQKCTKFVDYQNKTINTNGINLKLFGESINAGATQVIPNFREASDKLKQLDLLQYSICGQLEKIKNDFVRESLQSKYTSILMNIMQLVDNQGGSQLAALPQATAATTAETAKKVAVNSTGNPISAANTIGSDNATSGETVVPNNENNVAPTPAPAPVPTPTPTPAPTPAPVPTPAPASTNTWVDMPEMPCYGEKFLSTETAIRATSMGESMDQQTAKRMARTAALEELAAKIEVTVKTLTIDYTMSQKKNLTESLEQRFENRTETAVNQKLSGTKTVCEKYRQKGDTFQCLMALEINTADVVKGVYDNLKQDATLPVDNFNNFKEEFNKVMATYEENQ